MEMDSCLVEKHQSKCKRTFLPINCFMNIKYSPHWLWLIKKRKWKVWCALCLLPCWFSPGCSSRPLALLPFLSWLHNALFWKCQCFTYRAGIHGLSFYLWRLEKAIELFGNLFQLGFKGTGFIFAHLFFFFLPEIRTGL